MVWARIEEPTGRLQKMYEMLEDAFSGLGFKRENRLFHPHMTLGRVKGGRNAKQLRTAVADFADASFGIQGVDELVVFASELTSEGPVYSPLRRAPLGK
jgi:2'-5' RNA ligase